MYLPFPLIDSISTKDLCKLSNLCSSGHCGVARDNVLGTALRTFCHMDAPYEVGSSDTRDINEALIF
jgi:hypothetical protein